MPFNLGERWLYEMNIPAHKRPNQQLINQEATRDGSAIDPQVIRALNERENHNDAGKLRHDGPDGRNLEFFDTK